MAIHPFIQSVIGQVATRPALSAGMPAEARAMVAAGRVALGAGPQMASTREYQIPIRSGGAILARLHIPSEQPSGLIVYLHGGGWVLGCMDDYDALARTLAARSNCAVLLPEYRLAPEHRFPAPLHDVCDSIEWAAATSTEWLGRQVPLIVAGDSAGANLATVAARGLKDSVKIAAQILLYPVTDCDFSTSSYVACGEGHILTTKDMKWFFHHYADASLHAMPDISPLRADDLASLPPTLIMTAEYDVLKDEGRAYADRLRQSGVDTTYEDVAGVTHGFIRFHNLFAIADDAVGRVAGYVGKVCEASKQ